MKLGDLLDLLYTAHSRYSSIQVTWQYWYRVDMMNEALKKWAAQYPQGSVRGLGSAKRFQNEKEMVTRWHVWWQKPSCWRDEYQIETQGMAVRIICDDHWWLFNSTANQLYTNAVSLGKAPHLHIHRRESSEEMRPPRVEDVINEVPLLDPSFLLASHDLQHTESTLYAKREAVGIRAVFRKGKDLPRADFFWGAADEYELLVDKERGILLRYAAKIGGQEFAIASVDHVIFDEPIPEGIFSFTPSSNTSVHLVS